MFEGCKVTKQQTPQQKTNDAQPTKIVIMQFVDNVGKISLRRLIWIFVVRLRN